MRQAHNQHHKCRKQGGALITAIFIAALAAIMATALAVDETLLIHESRLAMEADHAYLVLNNAQDIAELTIAKYVNQWKIAANGQVQTTGQLQGLPSPLQALGVGGLVISTTLQNAQGRFNLNDLAYPQNQENFVLLALAVMPTMQPSQARAIAAAITDWMRTGKDDKYYASLDPGYVASQNQFADKSELRLVEGVTPSIYTALSPYIVALPIAMPKQNSTQSGSNPQQQIAPVTPVDVNAASAPVLQALNPSLNATSAASIVDCRQASGPFSTVQAFTAACVTPSGGQALQNVTAQSQYFLVHTETHANHTIVWMKSLIMTEQQKNNTLRLVKVWQAFE